ncbi:PAK-related kinase [Aspergillus flavus]|nr:PAK-related kinase [Aspergillus flavus]RAQ80328.1 PAK-related kinase [Aspergillus flavus]
MGGSKVAENRRCACRAKAYPEGLARFGFGVSSELKQRVLHNEKFGQPLEKTFFAPGSSFASKEFFKAPPLAYCKTIQERIEEGQRSGSVGQKCYSRPGESEFPISQSSQYSSPYHQTSYPADYFSLSPHDEPIDETAPIQKLNSRGLAEEQAVKSQDSLLPPTPEPLRYCDLRENKTVFPKPSISTMDPPRGSKFLDPTSAMAAITKHKAEAIKLAREQGVAVQEMCRRAKTDTPPYEFEELIGKGAYGRVYKGHQLPSRKVVAIKVMDIDSLDYKSVRDFRDESIKDFIHETKVMKQVKDSGAKNINEIIEAISIHSQLWLVCEYCPGGSVRTLMRATGDQLDEKFLIPVARELAAGLRAIHDAGIIHRDIKAANILIHEEGRLQICDFGVAGVLQSQLDKRSTWIGTPHWMPPEMFSTRGEAHKYGSEIDVWAYGCTLFEIATGNPPNSNLRERMQIGRQLNRVAPKLENAKYSEGLKDIVSYVLESNPSNRPTMADVQLHAYIADTEEAYPTSSLSELVRIYYQWSQRGGQRISLFHPGGAAAAEMPGTTMDSDSDWNFSTTDGFERRFSVIDLDQIAASLAEMEDEISTTNMQPPRESFDDPAERAMTKEDQANFDERVRRGAEAMEGLFNEEKPSYTYETKNDFVPIEEKQPVSDLPLRTETDRSSVTSTFIDIDIGSFDSSHYAAGASSAQPFQLADADTIKANRSSGRQSRNPSDSRSRSSSSDVSNREIQDLTYQPQSGPRPPTMDWKFPVFMQAPEQEPQTESHTESQTEPQTEPQMETSQEPASVEPGSTARRATMDWTFPVMTAATGEDQDGNVDDMDNSRYDTLRAPVLDLEPAAPMRPTSIGEPGDSRPSTSASTHSRASVSISSDTDYDPFRFDRPSTPPGGIPPQRQILENDYPELLTSTDDQDDDQSSVLDGPGPDEEESHPVWQDNSGVSDPTLQSEPFPTAIPTKDLEPNPPFAGRDDSPSSEPLPTVRRAPLPSALDGMEPILFPDLVPPRLEVMHEGADEGDVTAEMDRLLGDLLSALSATGEALSRTRFGPEVANGKSSTPEIPE